MSVTDYLARCPQEVKQAMIIQSFNCGETILFQDDEAKYLHILTQGRAKVYSLTETGTKYMAHIYEEGGVFGEIELLNNQRLIGFIEAITSCEVAKIPRDSFLKWVKIDSEFSLFMMRQLADKMYQSNINMQSIMLYPLKYQVLFFLSRYTTAKDYHPLSKDMLVEGVGSNIRSINRIIKELVDENIMVVNKGILIIVDLKMLLHSMNAYNER